MSSEATTRSFHWIATRATACAWYGKAACFDVLLQMSGSEVWGRGREVGQTRNQCPECRDTRYWQRDGCLFAEEEVVVDVESLRGPK